MMTLRQLLTLFGCALAVLFSFACTKDRNPEDGEAPITSSVETGDEQCSDGLDNDADGLIDCCDYGCRDIERCQPGGGVEFTEETCFDCLDNDDDGSTDCEDNGCAQHGDQDIRDRCAVILENTQNAENTDEKCSDYKDNDNDKFIDCQDFGCSHNPEVTVCN